MIDYYKFYDVKNKKDKKILTQDEFKSKENISDKEIYNAINSLGEEDKIVINNLRLSQCEEHISFKLKLLKMLMYKLGSIIYSMSH